MSFSNKFSKRFHDHRARKNAEKSKNRHHSTRAEYLLNEETPFDVTEAFRNLKASLSVSVPKKQGGIAYAEQRMQEYYQAAIEQLQQLPKSAACQSLLELADFITKRKK